MINKTCQFCNKSFDTYPSVNKKFCNRKCSDKGKVYRGIPPVHFGKNNPRWNGGKTTDRYGYVKVFIGDHPMADIKGYVYEHRLVMSQKIGRILTRYDVVHHINGNRKDNRLENLELTNDHFHKSGHGKIKSNLVYYSGDEWHKRHNGYGT